MAARQDPTHDRLPRVAGKVNHPPTTARQPAQAHTQQASAFKLDTHLVHVYALPAQCPAQAVSMGLQWRCAHHAPRPATVPGSYGLQRLGCGARVAPLRRQGPGLSVLVLLQMAQKALGHRNRLGRLVRRPGPEAKKQPGEPQQAQGTQRPILGFLVQQSTPFARHPNTAATAPAQCTTRHLRTGAPHPASFF
ncbi:hypothetical protein CLU86_3021 [Acidovorax sp. 62]|nr:hypothetical protein CLU86_3021 [Acidovorax sp. 62]